MGHVAILDGNFLGLTAIVTVAYQLFFFVIAAGFKFDKVTDFAGTTNFVVLALLTLAFGGTWYARQVLLTALVVVWGLRLGLFLLFRILQWGEDRRFDETRNNTLKFAVFWVFQALWVWLVTLPVTLVNATAARNPPLGAADAFGCLVCVLGLLLEGAADAQKLRFKRGEGAEGGSSGRWCDVGVWRWSRHPNYCGEIMVWVGVLVVASPVLQGAQWLAVLSPSFTAATLLFLSGMPILEASANRKFGHRADSRQYRAQTSPLVPLPPRLYALLPPFIKFAFLLELPMYADQLPVQGGVGAGQGGGSEATSTAQTRLLSDSQSGMDSSQQ
eukprot:TRINITY_DN8510_c0_g1_i1.p1 TRINITY_DN8510_c0_g1~~TRINITY_DN8510_c0_g1_i1.p1  ORF type:complete len:388 (+),score=-6.94 TRINITY_DN8510_c0_g1_i1:176-1165(+)